MNARRLTIGVVAAAIALAGCLPTSPPPSPRRVLLLGDSLMVQTADQLDAAASAAGLPATFNDKAFYGEGLLDPINSQDAVSVLVQEVRDAPDSTDVVIEFLGNCLPTCQASYPPGSAAFYTAWGQQVVALQNAIWSQFPAMHVWWVISPRIGGSIPEAGLSPDACSTLSWYDRNVYGATVDWWTPLNDAAGNYQRSNLRADDDVHLTATGARVTADATVAALRTTS